MRKQQTTRKDYMPHDTILKYQTEVNYVIQGQILVVKYPGKTKNDMHTIQDSVYSW